LLLSFDLSPFLGLLLLLSALLLLLCLALVVSIRAVLVALGIYLEAFALLRNECLLTEVFDHVVHHWLFVGVTRLVDFAVF